MRQKLFSILTLLLMAVSGAWAQTPIAVKLKSIAATGGDNQNSVSDVKCTTIELLSGGSAVGSATVNGASYSGAINPTSAPDQIRINFSWKDVIADTYYDAIVASINETSGKKEFFEEDDWLLLQITANFTCGPKIDVTGVALSQASADMTVGGDALTLTATVAPDNATDQTVTWTTSDASVATVANGVVTAVGAGTATITATAINGTDDTSDDKTATCTVSVHAHNYTYSLSDDGRTITAFCADDNHSATLTIGAPEGGFEAKITDEDRIQGDATVGYFNADENGDKTGDALGSAPTAVGKYWAEITLGEGSNAATAHVVYEIPAAVSIGEQGYSTFQAAIDNIQNGETIKLLTDLTGCFTYDKSGVTATLDLNGHTIDGQQKGTVLTIQNGTFILDDSSEEGTGTITSGNIGGKGNGGGVAVNGGAFTLRNGTIANNISTNWGGGVGVTGGTFTMENGTIKNNSARYGGGVCVVGGTFTMTGGTIEGNTASVAGGGVSEWDQGGAAKFVLTNGTIQGNTAPLGGGVDVWSTFEMNGGSIVDNTVSNGGGGIYVNNGGTMKVSGIAVVKDNTLTNGKPCDVKHQNANGLVVTVAGELQNGAQIGIFNNNQTNAFTTGYNTYHAADAADKFFFSDDLNYEIEKNASGELVFVNHQHNFSYVVDGATLTATCKKEICPLENHTASLTITATNAGATLTGSTTAFTPLPEIRYYHALNAETRGEALDPITTAPTAMGLYWAEFTIGEATAHVVYEITPVASIGENEYLSFQDAFNAVADGQTIKLYSDVTGCFTFNKAGVTATLDLNGHTIDGQQKGTVLTIQNGTFILDDSSEEGTGTITSGNIGGNGNGGGVAVNGGAFTLRNGTIANNISTNWGGGVGVTGGTFTMENGTIKNNSATRYGGGVCIVGGTFTMTGGTIEGNTASVAGGGVSGWDQGGAAKFVLTNGTIQGNTAPLGGGVDVWSTFEMNGGSIVDNTVSNGGGGIYVNNGGTMKVSGIAVVKDNTLTNGKPCDVKHQNANGLVVTVAGELQSGAQIGIFNNNQTNAFTTGYYTYHADDAADNFFFSNDPNKEVSKDGNGELIFSTPAPIVLAEDVDNSTALSKANGGVRNVTLTRTLQTGGWNTFCAPFSTGTPSGWTVKELTSASLSDGTLSLNFQTASSIEAGKPYLVKVGADVVNPTFNDVEVSKDAAPYTSATVDFIPTLGATTIEGSDPKSVLFLASENKLKNPTALPTDMKGFRAYFQLKGEAANARSFTIGMGDGTTGIISIDLEDGEQSINGIYTIDGRKLESMPTKKGVYIVNGKKVVIK